MNPFEILAWIVIGAICLFVLFYAVLFSAIGILALIQGRRHKKARKLRSAKLPRAFS